MICVQTKDGTDEEKTMRVAEIIRDLGIWEHCTYKLEVYTGLDIFRSNDYGLRPIIYKH
jgi:thymidylate synthase ThyX